MKRFLAALLVLAPRLLLAQPPTAELEARLAEARGADRVEVLSQLGQALRGQEDLAGALTRFRSSLKLAREIGYRKAIVSNLLAIGQIHLREGRLPAAAETLRRARVAAAGSEAQDDLPDILASQAEAYSALGRHQEGFDTLRQAQEMRTASDAQRTAARIADLETRLESERRQAEIEGTTQRQEISRQREAIARLEPRAERYALLALFAAIAVPLLLLGLISSLLSQRRLETRLSRVIADRDLELERTSSRLKSTSAELERTAAELERETFEHDRATSELAQTSSELHRTSAELHEATALRDQTAVSLAETAGQLRRTEGELRRTSELLGQALRQLEETEGDLDQLKRGYQRDIAELGDRNAAAQDRVDEMERFSSTMAQHLKILLVSIRGSLGALRRDAAAGDVEQLKRDVERTRGSVGDTVRLLDKLLNLLMVGRVVRAPEEVPFSELAFEAAGQIAGLVANRRAEIVIAPDLPTVVGDRAQLLEVLRNLLENGGKFMGDEPAPRLEVGWQRDESEAGVETVFFVRDNGIGIDPRDHRRVFNLFEQLDPEAEGVGIGLALVKRILNARGGRIWVESEGAGRGAAFCFSLPAATE